MIYCINTSHSVRKNRRPNVRDVQILYSDMYYNPINVRWTTHEFHVIPSRFILKTWRNYMEFMSSPSDIDVVIAGVRIQNWPVPDVRTPIFSHTDYIVLTILWNIFRRYPCYCWMSCEVTVRGHSRTCSQSTTVSSTRESSFPDAGL